jgi:putative phosphoesterase
MRTAVLSDIHGNVWALDAVLDHTARRGVDRFLNLGDIVYGPLEPRRTFERLQTLGATTIQGNQDREIYEAPPEPAHPTLRYVVENLGFDAIEWLRALPKTAVAGEIFACHGSPSSDLEYLLEDVRSGSPALRDDAAISRDLRGVEQPVIVCGHTHHARVVRLRSGQLVVNAGSVGLPAYDDDQPVYHAMESHSPHASYSIIEGTNVELHRVDYDFERAASAARSRGRDDWARWLTTGRAG